MCTRRAAAPAGLCFALTYLAKHEPEEKTDEPLKQTREKALLHLQHPLLKPVTSKPYGLMSICDTSTV